MNRIVLVIVLLLIMGALDLYGFQAIKTAFRGNAESTRQIIYILYWSLSGLISLGIAFGLLGNPDSLGKTLRTVLMVSVVTYFLSKIVLVLFVLIDDIVRFFRWGWQQVTGGSGSDADTAPKGGDTITRSQFLMRMGLVAAGIPSVGISFGIISGAHDYRVRKRTVYLPNLPAAFDGITITQLSDIHSGSFWNKTAVKGGIELANAQKSDLLFFTGDLVNNRAVEMKDYVEHFARLDAPLGVYSVLGNHDYGDYTSWPSAKAKQQNLQDLKEVHGAMGWNLLLNENRIITESGEHLAIMGIENWGTGGFAQYGKMQEAITGTEEATAKLLLSHDPSHWRAQVLPEYQDIDVAFAGHTHGMQFGVEIPGFRWSPVQYRYPEWADLYHHEHRYLYVNRGFGYIGYPGRIGIPPEITVLTLKKGTNLPGRAISLEKA